MEKDSFKEENEALGYRIRELRENYVHEKISQEELSYKTGNAKKTIGEIERGNTNPTYETLLKISMMLDLTINQLFDFDMPTYIRLSQEYKERKKKK
ncbi:helix-turn-helix transcriptional regulator [Flavobacterium sp. JP2137]|uniref:helix-turn-helix transcriptional regulator n=1 Tax=Flavobacterium sp. JP2137 TaxID=3414510 RepID=UPI003D300122